MTAKLDRRDGRKEEETKLNNSKIRPKGWSEKYTGPTALCSVILQTAVNYQIKTEKRSSVLRCSFHMLLDHL